MRSGSGRISLRWTCSAAGGSVGTAVAETVGVWDGVGVASGAASPGWGAACTDHSAAVSLSSAVGERASDWPAAASWHDGSKTDVLAP